MDYDASIGQRVALIQAGYSPNGHTPETDFRAATSGADEEAEKALASEYRWALSLKTYPYAGNASQDILMDVAHGSLIESAKTYDPDREPNFLIHLSDAVDAQLTEVFGEPETTNLPKLEVFEDYVLESDFSELPPLPKAREASEFSKDQLLLYLIDGELVQCRVQSVREYEGLFLKQGEPVQLSDEEMEHRTKALETAIKMAPNDMKSQGGFTPEVVKAMIGLVPGLQRFTGDSNPSPGHILLRTEPGSSDRTREAIIDMNRSEVIPIDAWQAIKSSPEYRELYLANGTPESMRNQEVLATAITRRMEAEGMFRRKVASVALHNVQPDQEHNS